MERILITGAAGQLGKELSVALSEKFGGAQVWATDINPEASAYFDFCQFTPLDVMDKNALEKLVCSEKITQIYHLAALLSATGEKNPLFTWQLNMESLLSVLELARTFHCKVYWPSSIAVFGKSTPRDNTPQFCSMDPTTVYGISKLAGERWCEYYFQKYGVDVRSIRYPGLIGYKSAAGGGTTDYAVDIYHAAIKGEVFKCFLQKDTYLPMMYMPDAITATLQLMEAPSESISIRSSYNLAALSFCPQEIYQSLLPYFPDFIIEYVPDFRQQIADSWPNSIDDSPARSDWGWNPAFSLERMTADIVENLRRLS